jgi:hypothetical protein
MQKVWNATASTKVVANERPRFLLFDSCAFQTFCDHINVIHSHFSFIRGIKDPYIYLPMIKCIIVSWHEKNVLKAHHKQAENEMVTCEPLGRMCQHGEPHNCCQLHVFFGRRPRPEFGSFISNKITSSLTGFCIWHIPFRPFSPST